MARPYTTTNHIRQLILKEKGLEYYQLRGKKGTNRRLVCSTCHNLDPYCSNRNNHTRNRVRVYKCPKCTSESITALESWDTYLCITCRHTFDQHGSPTKRVVTNPIVEVEEL